MNKKIVIIVCALLIIVTSGVIFKVTKEKKDKVSIATKEKLEMTKLPLEKDDYIGLNVYFSDSKEKDASIVKEERLINKEELIVKYP